MTRMDRPDTLRNMLADLLTVFPDTGPRETPYLARLERLGIEQNAGGLFLDADGGFSEHTSSDAIAEGQTLIEDKQIGQVFQLRFDAALTSTEKRVLRSIIAGRSVREISARDSVAHETRRNQLKTIMAKAGISRQVDLVAIMSTLLAMAALKPGKDEIPPPVRGFLDRFHGRGLRIYSPHLPSGRRLLLLERGPADGRPVLHMHSAFFPLLPIDDARLDAIGIRIITPLRPGFFGLPVDWQAGANARTQTFVDDLATVLRDFRLDHVPVFGHAHGATAAVALCARLGDRGARLTLLSAQAGGPDHRGYLPLHVRAHQGLARNSPKMLTRTYRLLGHSIVRPDNLDQVLHKFFGHSRADLQALRDPGNRAWLQALFCDIGQSNIAGIVSDSQLFLRDWVEALGQLPMTRTVIYGGEDRYANFDSLASRCAETGAELRIIAGQGSLSLLFAAETLLREAAGLPPQAVR